MNRKLIGQAFMKSLPVMAGYFVIGIGYGLLLRSAGYGVLWALAAGVLIYAGSMQYVGVGLLAGGASVITAVITTLMVNTRHLFYSVSMIDRYKNTGKYKPYLIFALTDETYSLLCDKNLRKRWTPDATFFSCPCSIGFIGLREAWTGFRSGSAIPSSASWVEWPFICC